MNTKMLKGKGLIKAFNIRGMTTYHKMEDVIALIKKACHGKIKYIFYIMVI